MNTPDLPPEEETLDPEDWPAMRALAHRMVDDMMTYLETVRERPVWTPLPDEVKAHFAQPLPEEPQEAEGAYRDFRDNVLPYAAGNIHPRFWGWARGSGTVLGMLAEMLAAGMNPHVGGGQHSAVYVERQVLDWCKALLGYPAEASGLLLSGTSMANFTGLAVARNTRAEGDVRRAGVGAMPRPMTVYGSREMHSSIQKAVEMLGLGSDALRRIPVDAQFRVDCDALERAIAQDRAAGYRPLAIVGCAGTVNTGSFDDLDRLADIAQREDMWFHVDGAFGALAAIEPELRCCTSGMARADSLAFDLHKWMYMPIEAGCLLVRDAAAHRRAFVTATEYLAHSGRGFASELTYFADLGMQLTRGFRALKVWMSLKEHGAHKYTRLIRQNVDQARYLRDLVDAAPRLQRTAPVPLNIVCFRYFLPECDDAALDALNRELVLRLQEGGNAICSSTTLNGCYSLRVAITNHRSARADFDFLAREVVRLGDALSAAG